MKKQKKTRLHLWAESEAKKVGFQIKKIFYQAGYYVKNNVRNIIYDGIFNNQPAVLKVYDDPRMSIEPIFLQAFHKHNTSKILTAPQLYKYKVISPHVGWLIMEKLVGGEFLVSPLDSKGRQKFVKIFLEYRLNFPTKPTRPLTLAEQLPPDEFHHYRIHRWFELATSAEAELVLNNKTPILNPKQFLPYYVKGIKLIRKEFSQRERIWCHGHFKPKEIYQTNDKYYLTDFAHSQFYPLGYEFAFIIWADYLMASDYSQPYSQWKSGVFDWIDKLKFAAKKLKIKNYQSLIRASIIERILGTFLADICASDFPREKKLQMVKYLYKLFDELMK